MASDPLIDAQVWVELVLSIPVPKKIGHLVMVAVTRLLTIYEVQGAQVEEALLAKEAEEGP